MIKIQRVSKEARQRDIKRRRFLLTIGRAKYHLTVKEVKRLRGKLNKYNLTVY